jgi:hypothetical protein
MVKSDSTYPSEVQKLAQEQLRELLQASAHYDNVINHGQKLGEALLVVQEAAAANAAVKRCVAILTDANSDDECAEALRLVASIIDNIEHALPSQ